MKLSKLLVCALATVAFTLSANASKTVAKKPVLTEVSAKKISSEIAKLDAELGKGLEEVLKVTADKEFVADIKTLSSEMKKNKDRLSDSRIKQTVANIAGLSNSLKSLEAATLGKKVSTEADRMNGIVKTMISRMTVEILKNDKNLDQIDKVIEILKDLTENDIADSGVVSMGLRNIETRLKTELDPKGKNAKVLDQLRECKI